MSREEVVFARQALIVASGCARRLERSQKTLASRFPLTASTVTTLPAEAEDHVDAFLKRFEQLVNTLQDEVFKAIAMIGEEDLRTLSRRDVAELMERLGALPSAATFRALTAIRIRIAHVYPDDPERQARNRNEAYGAIADLLAAHVAAKGYLERRLRIATPG